MKVFYITGIDKSIASQNGILKKVLGQSNALLNENNIVYLSFIFKNKIIIKDIRNNRIVKEQVISGNKLFFRIKMYSFISKWIKLNQVDNVFFRFDGIDPIVLYYLNYLKKDVNKIVLELPTYPFNLELEGRIKKNIKNRRHVKALASIIYYIISNFSYKFAHRVIDKIVTYMPYDKIWGIDVLEIDNGIDINSIRVKKESFNEDRPIFICVANVSKWHGLDRLINGLNNYKKYKRAVPYIWIVGDGSEIPTLKKLVKDSSLEDNVIFFGNKTGEELDVLIDKADIGIGSLGMHRIGLKQGSTLKVKEYFSRGLPFIYSYDEKLIADDYKYALKFPQNDNHINIDMCMEFYYGIKDNSDVTSEMRNFAKKNFDWKVQMKVIFNYFEGD